MEKNIKLLLDKIDFSKDHYNFFSSAKLTKLKLFKGNKSLEVYIEIDNMVRVDIFNELESKIYKLDNRVSKINIFFNVKNKDLNLYKDYFNTVLSMMKGKINKNLFVNSIEVGDNKLNILYSNTYEHDILNKNIDLIKEIYSSLGYDGEIDLKENINKIELNSTNEVLESSIPKEKFEHKEVKEEKKFTPGEKHFTRRRKEEKAPENIIGVAINDTPISLHSVVGEDNNVCVEAKIFGVEYFESSKSDFKIITLKITDFTDSIYCKVFTRDADDYKRLTKELSIGTWIKVRGYTKNDQFSKELVLNARDIKKVDHKDEEIKDTYPEKRVELHAHTKMSQMDGLCDETELVKRAIKYGHKAIAITDHNGCQAFPHVFDYVTKYNKGLPEGKEKFKALYGTELTLIDDRVDIVIRPTTGKLLDKTYVVFDFETTGFNAGGVDQIIEIGAVKIKEGMVIDKYDELINPGRPLPERITAVTNITDDMLENKDTEENAIKRFIKWFGDLPMVAHNAKFDVSFLEMCYKKYNLGTFTNTVIDTLELSRTLDNNYSRHSLSALVKRYNVPWDESAHHRGDYDAEGTAYVLWKMLEKLNNRNIETMEDLENMVPKDEIYKYGRSYHVNLIAKNKTGLKNLFKIISLANTTYIYKTPRIPRSVLDENREGILVGSGCYESEVFVLARSKPDDELSNIIRYYDYVEVQPLECYSHLLQTGDFSNNYELSEHLKKIIRTTKDCGKLIVATGDVHHIDRADKIYREIIVNQKVPGGGRHPLARGGIKEIPSNHFRTTNEMMDDFKFLEDDNLAHEIVIDNPNKIADMCDIIEVIPDTGGIPFSPRVKGDDGEYLDCPRVVTDLVMTKAKDWYGDPLPHFIEDRIATELYGDILKNTITANLKEQGIEDEDKIFEELDKYINAGKGEIEKLLRERLKKDDPSLEKEALEKTLKKKFGGVIGGGFDPIYLIAQRLVKHSNDEGFLVGSRGSVGSSFVATMMGITEVNPLPAHYRCPKCKRSFFNDDDGVSLGTNFSTGFDLPDKECPNCHIKMIKDGQDMPFATFLGFNADKVPDIDLNFSDLNQASAHAYTKVLFGEDNVYRAGTIGTVAEKTAYGFVKGYEEEHGITGMRSAEIERLAAGCTGVKRTTGQHPGGIVVIPDYKSVFDFTPFQYPADDPESPWRTTHFDYHAIDQCVLKLDILGHSDPTQLRLIQLQSGTDIMKVPLDDKATMSIFTSTEALGVTEDQIMCKTGTLGIPEFGTPFTIQLVEDTKPTTFGELIKISGLSHGTDVWLGNAQDLIKNNIVPFKETIGCRDDIMVYLMYHGLEPIKAFKIMEFVRKGRPSKSKKPDDPETWKGYVEDMRKAGIPEWFIGSCAKIKYMFPKAHAAAYVISAFRIAWYKVHMPVYFYSSWYTSKATDVDLDAMIGGYDKIRERVIDIQNKGYEATNKENGQLESLKVALEGAARGIKVLNVDLYKSDATVWTPKNDTEMYPPFSAIDGLGDTVAKKIVEERAKAPFVSKEDIQKRAKVSQTLIEKMTDMGIISDLPDTNQLSLF